MSTPAPAAAEKPSLQVQAQAATWLAALRGPNRTPALVSRFKQWLAESEQHRSVWESMTEGWELAGAMQVDLKRVAAAAEREARGARFVRAMAASIVAAILLGGGAFYYLRQGAISTAVGEQRVMTLKDGTRVVLNTDTRIRVRYGKADRRVTLQRGEALFDVAKHPAWPFIVTAGDREIRALGTSFVVREDPRTGFSVTLVEGKVTVSTPSPVEGREVEAPWEREVTTAHSPVHTRGAGSGATSITLVPGQRLTIARDSTPQLDRPELKRVTAWQRGEVAFDETPLAAAIAEMNRYSTTPIRVEGSPLPDRRISGFFRAGDSQDFARGIAQTYRLDLTERDHQLVLSVPDAASP